MPGAHLRYGNELVFHTRSKHGQPDMCTDSALPEELRSLFFTIHLLKKLIVGTLQAQITFLFQEKNNEPSEAHFSP